ncbi:MAG TPA: dethiobiotin synthase [Alphaproteobacteria bacterium]|nr:dethiobiotin synthase [Rhodospirillaceae bacterium]HRJ12277.1 dethiobiotin synthase [Alphaproteobacteria bacterium]
MRQFIITGTDTDAGKTLAAACLLLGTGGHYWKPLQSGRDPKTGMTDREWVQNITQLPDTNFFPETYQFEQPLSPHRAAELENVQIDPEKILSDYAQHTAQDSLLIEGAGGLMVPVTRNLLQIDLFVRMQTTAPAPIILVARTGLGTINHTLLSLAAIRERGLPLHGILFSGADNPDNIQTITESSGARVLGHIPFTAQPDTETLRNIFTQRIGNL